MKIALLASALYLCLGGIPASANESAEPLNILFVMTDQHSARVLGSYGNGFGGVQQSITPNLDRLAQEGVRFDAAFCAAPQCCPSRFSVLTGRWPHIHGVRSNKVWEPAGHTTFPELARQMGYATGTFGKHHMMWLDQPVPRLVDHGFDEVNDLDDYKAFCAANGRQVWSAQGNRWSMPDMPASLGATGFTYNTNAFHPAGYFTNRTLRFLDERALDERPFVCWFIPYGPHTPLLPSAASTGTDWAHLHHPFDDFDLPPNIDKIPTTQRLAQKQGSYSSVDEKEWRQVLSYYYGLVSQIDFNIGRVLQRLEELDMARNTLVVYTSDHGEMSAEMACWTKGAGHYDATDRIPLIMRLPGVLPEGLVIDELVNNLDFFPTFVELAGLPQTDEHREALDGRSLVPLMLGEVAQGDWPDHVYSESNLPPKRTRMIRTKTARYSFDERNGGEEEFYDLQNDPWELYDLSGALEPIEADRMRNQLSAWWDDEAGHAPIYRDTDGPDSVPLIAEDPFPGRGVGDVPRDIDPTWLPCTAAETQRVFLGTDASNLQPFGELGRGVSSFNAGTLAANTTYYWRVDGTNANGTTLGEVWSFTTELQGNGGPGLVTGPIPAQAETGVPLNFTLQWTPAADANRQQLYFGPEGQLEPEFLLTSLESSYVPGGIEGGTTYQWRIDTISADGTTQGDLWTFTTTSDGLPSRAQVASPGHLATDVAAQVQLKWQPGADAHFHDVYFGTSFPLALQARIVGQTNYDPGPLQAGETYYWRIDEGNSDGITLGSTWRFRVE